MKSLIKKLVWSLAASSILMTASAQSAPKIAVVDLQKIFDSYWKTKQAQAQLKDREQEFNKNGASMYEDYKKFNDDYKKLVESATDPAVSSEEKEKRTKQAAQKLIDIRGVEDDIKRYQGSMRASLEETVKRDRDNILRDIGEDLNKLAKKAGYTQVFNLTGETAPGTRILLYNSGGNDLTDDVIAVLNSSAPASLPATSTEAKPAPGNAAAPVKDDKKDAKKPAGK